MNKTKWLVALLPILLASVYFFNLKNNTERGLVAYNQQQYHQATIYLKKGIESILKRYGHNHPLTATGYEQLGLAYQQTDQLSRAISTFKIALNIRKELANNLGIANNYIYLGKVYKLKEDIVKSITYYRRALMVRRKVFGPKHELIAVIYDLMGDVYLSNWRSRYKNPVTRFHNNSLILIYYQKSLAIRQELFGKDSLNVALSHIKLGKSPLQPGFELGIQSWRRPSVEYGYSKALKIRLNKLGPKRSFITASSDSFGVSYNDGFQAYVFNCIQRMNDDCKLLKKTIEQLGNNNILVAQNYYHLGLAHYRKSRYKQSIQYFYKSLSIRKKLSGINHPGVAVIYSMLGIAYSGIDKKKSIAYRQQALKIRLITLGPNHRLVARSYNLLASILFRASKSQSIEYYKKSLKIQLKTLGEQHRDVESTLFDLSIIHYVAKRYDKAIKYYQHLIRVSKAIYDEDSPSLSVYYNGLANSYLMDKQYSKSIINFNKSIKIENVNGAAKADIADSHYGLSRVYQATGDYSKSVLYAEKSVSALCAKKKSYHRLTLMSDQGSIKIYIKHLKELKKQQNVELSPITCRLLR